jgi:cytoskeletal protein CcmA (bactofilin family)
MNDDKDKVEPNGAATEGESLETVQSGADSTSQSSQTNATPQDSPPPLKKSPKEKITGVIRRLNIYFLLFILLLLVAGIIAFVAFQSSKNSDNETVIQGQELTQEELEELAKTNTEIGDPKSTVTIASNAVFNGRLLVRDSLDVAGTIRVGGALSLPGITVSGTSNFDIVQVASTLSVAGNSSVQGDSTVGGALTVSRGASFGGPISAPALNIETLALNNDITLNRHISTGGGTPGSSAGGGVGGGGTVSVGGSDIAGTVTINTGGGATAGILANIQFINGYGRTPHVVISPVGTGAAALDYYVTRTPTGFSIGTTNNPPAATSFSFDYIVIN